LRADSPSPKAHLEKTLIVHGLYPREAKAMVESWRDSWFEHGTRLLYIVSEDAVNAMLPLRIDPQPAEVKRVFVGRMEIATPATLQEVKRALDTRDVRRLEQYGRFLEPIAKRLGVSPGGVQIRSSSSIAQVSRGTCGSVKSS
jgi:hypothetical protein